MSEKQHPTESDRILGQLPDRYDPVGADLSSFGMGSFQDFQRHLVLPLQSRFQEEVRGDDGGGNLSPEPIKPIILDTLHDQLLYYVLELADSIRFGLDKLSRLTNTVRTAYKKYFSWLAVRTMDDDR